VLFVAVILVGLVAYNLYSGFSAPPSSGLWNSTYVYPLQLGGATGVVGQSCIDSAGYVYCIGGEGSNQTPTSSVYYASASASGVANWTLSANPYPQPIVFESCVAAAGYVYCVGGTHDSTGDDTAASYFATLSPAGVGGWVSSTPYPVAIDALSCVAASQNIYCVGGENETSGTSSSTAISSAVWYAPISSAGIGSWSRSADYPSDLYFPSCAGLGAYIYCVGGENSQDVPQNSTYYSYSAPSGMGAWAAGPDYPIQTIAESCVTSDSSVYCVGGLQSGGATTGAVYYSTVSSSTMGPWQTVSSYPIAVATDCAANNGFLFCVGGYSSSTGATGESYYASLSSIPSSSTTT
jgi:hypothetical protein